jgi:response regulator NasT
MLLRRIYDFCGGEKMRTVIVVDDEPITRLDLTQMLTELGLTVAGEAGDGFDAVELCRATRPDVVLLDVRMPVFDGLGAAELIIDEDLAGCVVLLTAFSDRELIERAGRIGVTGYLVKPVEQRLILPTIEVAFAQSVRLREARRESTAVKQKLEDAKLIDRAKAILAWQSNISESQAYQELQRMAMNKRCTIASLAAAIVEQKSGRSALQRSKEKYMEQAGLSEEEAFGRIKAHAEKAGSSLEAAAQALSEAAEARKK